MSYERYCLRGFNRNEACIWVLDENNVCKKDSDGNVKWIRGYRTFKDNMIRCLPANGEPFEIDVGAFVPVSRVKCLYDSQVRRIIADGLADEKTILPSVESDIRKHRVESGELRVEIR